MVATTGYFLPERTFAGRRNAVDRTSAPRRRIAVLSTATRRWSRRGREVLLGDQDLQKIGDCTPLNQFLVRRLTIRPAVMYKSAAAVS